MPDITPLDDEHLPPHVRYAARALALAAERPGAMVLAICKNLEGNDVATLCMLSEQNHLYPFALVPDFDLCELLIPPAEYLTVQSPARCASSRRPGVSLM